MLRILCTTMPCLPEYSTRWQGAIRMTCSHVSHAPQVEPETVAVLRQ